MAKHYEAKFVSMDEEEGLRPIKTVAVPIWEEIYNALVESKIVEFEGKLFVYEDNGPDGPHRIVVTLTETAPTSFQQLREASLAFMSGRAALSKDTPDV